MCFNNIWSRIEIIWLIQVIIFFQKDLREKLKLFSEHKFFIKFLIYVINQKSQITMISSHTISHKLQNVRQ